VNHSSIWDRAISDIQTLGHLEDTIQSLVEAGNGSTLPQIPPAQNYETLFDEDTWDSLCTAIPSSNSPPETNRDQQYTQPPDNTILPSGIAPTHQESSPESLIFNESPVDHVIEHGVVSTTDSDEKDTLYEPTNEPHNARLS
jgi:hypothetical protein